MAKLVAEEGNLKGLILSLENGKEWVIGRDPDTCQLLIEDPVASRKHLIVRETDEGIFVENLSSTNPVEINQEEVKEPRLLKHGDTVKIGSGLYRFYMDTEAMVYPESNDISSQGAGLEKQAKPEEEAMTNPSNQSDINPEGALTDSAATSLAGDPKEGEAYNAEEGLKHDTIFDDKSEEEVLAAIDFDIVETGKWLLKVISGPNNGAEFNMQTGKTYIVGTDAQSADIIFHDTSVSRQHAKIRVADDDSLSIEDMGSKNGTLVDGAKLQAKGPLSPNSVVTLGTTSFVIFDREGEMQTIISPLLPSIVKMLQKEEDKKEEKEKEKKEEKPVKPLPPPKPQISIEDLKEKNKTTLTAFILIAIVTGLFGLMAVGALSLFRSEPVQVQEVVEAESMLKDAMSPFPEVQFSYNKANNTILLIGHVLTDNQKKQLLYNLQGLSFIKNIDDSGIIIDELVWRDINPMIARNPKWRGISIQATTPGNFQITGYLKSRKDLEELTEYLSSNFVYLDNLENKVFVEEDVVSSLKTRLQAQGIKNLRIELSNGDLSIRGALPQGKQAEFKEIITEYSKLPGIRSFQDFVTESEPERSMIDVTDRYEVSGISRSGGANLSVVVDGRILSKGDILDGMRVTEITPKAILLEKDGVKYRIELR
ncbi:type III secretion system inner membrane ring subunit SctD [Estrella lausannensis]|uniref:Putative type III secretion system protein SctD n=1 Tax=Estrella lausannensis TaxID=483423 RepID=A0A0H5E3G5_9BACT|nr:type III secretion system inner membrane ring subunit SctD [Estrella lausannensis]CRX37755.1 Putative type III secretion system protein SctD [Estrella lausannensis]